MGRRVCLSLQLAQKKRVIVLDEPFTGLDYESAVSVAKELVRLRQTQGTALLLISHEPHLLKLVMGDDCDDGDNGDKAMGRNKSRVVELKAAATGVATLTHSSSNNKKPSLFGTSFLDRFLERLLDYTLYSLPLVAMAFVACGCAISMLSADLLQRLDLSKKVLDLVDNEVKPLIKMLTGEDPSMIHMMGIRLKVNSLLNRTVPQAKATLYAIGLTKLFVLEVGPLLTALLLCGRIGGSYAGKVGTMQATNQNKLLKTLGVNPKWWTLYPSILAASVASPVLTVTGTCLALLLGGYVGPYYGIGGGTLGDTNHYWKDLQDSIFPVLRLKSFEKCWEGVSSSSILPSLDEVAGDGLEEVGEQEHNGDGVNMIAIFSSIMSILKDFLVDPTNKALDLRVTYKTNTSHASHHHWMKDTLVELATYPPVYHLLKSETFIFIIILVAEWVARSYKPNLTARGVPSVITFSVVLAGLLVIVADWAFSQLWLLRE